MIVPNNKISKPFNKVEQKLLKGHHASIARACDCTSAYVGQIASGDRNAKSDKAAKVLKALQTLLETLKQIHNPIN